MRRTALLSLALPSLALLGLLALACRKEPDPAPLTAAPVPLPAPEIAQAVQQAGPVLFVGLDGADWELLDEYMAAGVMPNLTALVREGRPGVLSTLHPPLPPLVWTTMMTGTSPLEHGILDFSRRNPETGALEPITSGERLVPAVWNMAADGGKSVAVFGLWATSPAEPVRGLLVADRFSSFTDSAEPAPGAVFPPEQEAWAREILRKTEEAVGYEALHEYLPGLAADEYETAIAEPDANPVSALRRVLVETRANHGLATSWLAKEHPSLAVVYFQGPRQNTVKAEDLERFSEVPRRYFAEVDRMLGDYRKLAEASGAVMMIASGHGFRAAVASKDSHDEGIYLFWGPGIEAGKQRDRGEAAQVCSTLLALLGLPPGQGVAGPPLPGVEATGGELADYRANYRENQPAPADTTRTAGSYDNEGLLRREKGEVDAAAAAFQQALDLDPKNASALWNLSELLRTNQKDLDRSDDLLVKALEGGLPEGVDFSVGRTVAYARAGDTARGLRLLDRALAVKPKEPRLLLLRGRYRLQRHQCERALGDFEGASRYDSRNALAFASVGLARLCIGDGEGAAQAFRQSLKIDPKQPEIRRALGQIGGG
jgi:tetratricopeptide (TPR) repeat protein